MRGSLVDFLSDLGTVFVDFSCLLGASLALFFCRVCVKCSGSFFLLPFVVVCYARKRRARRIYCKNLWYFMIFQSWSRRPRFEKKADHDVKRSDQKLLIFLFFAPEMPGERGGRKCSIW